MRKLGTYLLLTCFLLVSVFPGQAAAAAKFTDINSNWAKDAINRLSTLGYVNGYPDGKFKPDSSMTRAEFTSALIACVGTTTGDTTDSGFADTEKHWAKPRINAAVSQGILKPKEFYQNMFKPDEKIKRCEVAAMLVRACGQKADTGELPPFEDKAAIEKNGYRGYIKTAFDLKLMSGYPGGKFDPNGNMTRAQVCSVLSTFLDKKGGTTPVPASNQPAASGGITSVAIGDELYKLGSSQVLFYKGMNEVTVSTLSSNSGNVVVNGQYLFKLDSTTDNPDIVVNNLRYKVNRLSINGDKLLAYPSSNTIYSINVANHKYNGDFVKLYINSANSVNFLSDMQLLDKQTVKINDKNYDLSKDKITLELGSDFYDVKGIKYGTADTTLDLSLTDAVIKKGLSMSDFSAIFAGTTTLNLNNIKSMIFIINGTRYNLSNITIDANNNFSMDQKTISPNNVMMIVDSVVYKINSISKNNNKYLFYCNESTSNNWVVINDIYRDANDVKIIRDGVIYNMDQVAVVSLNLVRIASKQYQVDSTFKCRYDNKLYTIKRFDYDTSLQANVLEVTGSDDTSYLANQPVKFVFYRSSSKYLEGINDTVLIKVNGSWIAFSKILITDPSHFTYNNSSYSLLSAQMRINSTDFVIDDTAWHGRTQVLDIYID